MTTGLYIVRGQPPHKGHLHVIKDIIQKECDELIIAVGSAEEGFTSRNPLYGGERVKIFNRLLYQELDKPFSVYPIVDLKNPPLYARYMEAILPPFDVVYANRDTTPLFEERGYEGRNINVRFDNLSATSIRERIAKHDLSWIADVHPIVYDEMVQMDAIGRIRKIMNGEPEKVHPIVYRGPTLTVDVIIRHPEQDKIVLIERGKEPFKGSYAIPGGHVERCEQLEHAARREVEEETGLTLTNMKFFDFYDRKDRDPRGHYITCVYTADGHGELKTEEDDCDDARKAEAFHLEELPELAFDHGQILEDYKNRE